MHVAIRKQTANASDQLLSCFRLSFKQSSKWLLQK